MLVIQIRSAYTKGRGFKTTNWLNIKDKTEPTPIPRSILRLHWFTHGEVYFPRTMC